jgi:hypothetical protein
VLKCFYSFRPTNINVHEWERQSCSWTSWWKVDLRFGIADNHMYQSWHKWLKYQTLKSTETYFWCVWGCESFWTEAETNLDTVGKC